MLAHERGDDCCKKLRLRCIKVIKICGVARNFSRTDFSNLERGDGKRRLTNIKMFLLEPFNRKFRMASYKTRLFSLLRVFLPLRAPPHLPICQHFLLFNWAWRELPTLCHTPDPMLVGYSFWHKSLAVIGRVSEGVAAIDFLYTTIWIISSARFDYIWANIWTGVWLSRRLNSLQ